MFCYFTSPRNVYWGKNVVRLNVHNLVSHHHHPAFANSERILFCLPYFSASWARCLDALAECIETFVRASLLYAAYAHFCMIFCNHDDDVVNDDDGSFRRCGNGEVEVASLCRCAPPEHSHYSGVPSKRFCILRRANYMQEKGNVWQSLPCRSAKMYPCVKAFSGRWSPYILSECSVTKIYKYISVICFGPRKIPQWFRRSILTLKSPSSSPWRLSVLFKRTCSKIFYSFRQAVTSFDFSDCRNRLH